MQNKVPIERPVSFYEFVELIENYQRKSFDPIWYGGYGSVKHKLIPGLYRKPWDEPFLDRRYYSSVSIIAI